jgi:phospholipase/lecithinase/hemolysin
MNSARGERAVGCDRSTYPFWDGTHPTSVGHRLLAGTMLEVKPAPEPAMTCLFAADLCVLCLRRRGGRALPL